MIVLITGVYGFIGFSTAKRLLEDGHVVYGIDRVEGAVSPKQERIDILSGYDSFYFDELDLSKSTPHEFAGLMADNCIDAVFHSAGQYSVMQTPVNMQRYVDGNLVGFFNIIEACRLQGVRRFVYASSTFVQDGRVSRFMYGATKVFNEHCANVYREAYGLQPVGLRFGSTYGPHVRPDVGIYQVAKKLYRGAEIDVSHPAFHNPCSFVFIDDAVEVVVRCLQKNDYVNKHHVYTVVAEDEGVHLYDILNELREITGLPCRTFDYGSVPSLSRGRVPVKECAALGGFIEYAPQTKLREGLEKTVPWFEKHFGIK